MAPAVLLLLLRFSLKALSPRIDRLLIARPAKAILFIAIFWMCRPPFAHAWGGMFFAIWSAVNFRFYNYKMYKFLI